MTSMPGGLAGRGRVPDLDGPVELRRLKNGRLDLSRAVRFLWYPLCLAVAEMNYATRRMVELQAPGNPTTGPAEPASANVQHSQLDSPPLFTASGPRPPAPS